MNKTFSSTYKYKHTRFQFEHIVIHNQRIKRIVKPINIFRKKNIIIIIELWTVMLSGHFRFSEKETFLSYQMKCVACSIEFS